MMGRSWARLVAGIALVSVVAGCGQGATPDRQQRQGVMAQLLKIYTDVLPAIPIRFATHPWAYQQDLKGFRIGGSELSLGWSVPSWELR